MTKLSGERQNCSIEVFCQPILVTRSSDLWWQAMAFEITQDKIRLLCSKSYEASTFMCIEIVDRWLGAHVKSSRPRSNGNWIIECSWLNPLSKDDVRAFIKHSAAPVLSAAR